MSKLLVALSLLLVACGGRSLPTADGTNQGQDLGTRMDIGGVKADSSGPSSGCRDNNDCSPQQYCHLDSGCLVTGAKMGQCRTRPQACPEYYSPTCGCDGKTYGNPCDAGSAGVNVKHPGKCDVACDKVTCQLYNDCCMCEATKTPYMPPPLCPAKCKQPRCDGLGIRKPDSYCLAGHCLLANTYNKCKSDTDCYKVNDCCFCLALPSGVPYPPCPADCLMGHCTSLGLDKAQPACVNGICRLVLH